MLQFNGWLVVYVAGNQHPGVTGFQSHTYKRILRDTSPLIHALVSLGPGIKKPKKNSQTEEASASNQRGQGQDGDIKVMHRAVPVSVRFQHVVVLFLLGVLYHVYKNRIN